MSDYLTMAELENKTLKEIYTFAKEFRIPYYSQMNKKELSLAVIRAQAEKQGFFYMEGILDIVVDKTAMAFCVQSIMAPVQKISIFLRHRFVGLVCVMVIKSPVRRARPRNLSAIMD